MRMGVLRPSRRSSAATWKPFFLGSTTSSRMTSYSIDVGQHRGFFPVRGDVHGLALFLQALFDESGDLPVVLHDENFHGVQTMRRR